LLVPKRDAFNGNGKKLYISATTKIDEVHVSFQRKDLRFEEAIGRLEVVKRIKMWRFLTGDGRLVAHYWMPRLESKPQQLTRSA
jgi:hypothetical protein